MAYVLIEEIIKPSTVKWSTVYNSNVYTSNATIVNNWAQAQPGLKKLFHHTAHENVEEIVYVFDNTLDGDTFKVALDTNENFKNIETFYAINGITIGWSLVS